MNIAFYVDSLSEEDKINAINEQLLKCKVEDASIFYNNIAPLKINPVCGIFHAADMWSFEGVLIVSNIKNVIKASNIVNKFKIVYYFDRRDDMQVMDIIMHYNKADYVICNGEQMAMEFTRLTGEKPLDIINNYDQITGLKL